MIWKTLGRWIIIGSETKTIEEAKELYQEFTERLPLEPVKKGEENNVFYVSPDCKWVITIKWSEYKHTGTQTLFYEKEKVREKISSGKVGSTVFPILIIKDGDSYKEMDEEHYEKLSEMEEIVFYDGGYDDLHKINAEGNLLAGNYDDIMLSEIGKYPSQRAPGIYVEELATGRTAYIDIELSGFDLFDRNFLWIPKDAFDTYLKEGY